MTKLSPKQQRFCQEYVKCLNATKAAISGGYSPKTASSQGERLLRNVEIAAEIARLQKERSQRCEVEADDVLKRIHDLAHSDVFLVLDAARSGTVDQLPENVRQTVKTFKHRHFEKDGEVTNEYHIVMHDVQAPLNLLWKHVGLGQSDAEAIATLTTYGKVTKTKRGFDFEYCDFGGDGA